MGLFNSFTKTLVGTTVEVELKNDLKMKGVLASCDAYLNIKISDIVVSDPERYPHLMAVKNLFIRGSVIRYLMPDLASVDLALLEDATRRENAKEAI